MAIRTLKRKVIIREYDYNKIKEQALSIGLYADDTALYDRVSFIPLNQESLEKLKIIDILQGKKHTPLIATAWNGNIPAMMIYQLKDYLYDNRYFDWNVTTDEQGFICVQARKNTPKSRIGWGVFEKDMNSRI